MAAEVVGRGVELAAVEPFLARAGDGLAALVFEGEAGIGKSTIWEAAVETASARGWRVLSARPARSEQALTLGGLTDLLAGVDDDALADLPAPQRRALEIALLRVEPTGTAPDQRTLSVAVAGLLRLLARVDRPVLLAIDDAQWLDESTAAILAYALRRLADRPIALLAAVRTGAETPASDGLLAALPAETDRVHPRRADALASLHRLFQVRLGRSFPRLVLVRIEAASGGNPLYALEIASRALRDAASRPTPREPLPIPDEARRRSSRPACRGCRQPTRRDAPASAAAARTDGRDARTRAARHRRRPAARPSRTSWSRSTAARSGSAHPLFAQAVTSLGGGRPSFERPMSRWPGRRRPTTPAPATSRMRPTVRTRPSRRPSPRPPSDARLRGATLDAAIALPTGQPADAGGRRGAPPSIGPDSPPSACSSTCPSIVEADRILEARDRPRARPGPARAEALSLRAIIRYYHGRDPRGDRAGRAGPGRGRRRSRAPGDGARPPRRTSSCSSTSSGASGSSTRRFGSSRRRRTTTVDPDLARERPAAPARAALSLRWSRTDAAGEIERGMRPHLEPDGRSWEHEGADGLRVRARPHDGRSRPRDRDDPRADPGQVRAGRRRPVQLVSCPACWSSAATGRRRGATAEAGARGLRAGGRRDLPVVGPARPGARRGARRADGRGAAMRGARGWGWRSSAATSCPPIFHRHILGFVALSLGEWPRGRRAADVRRPRSPTAMRYAASGPVQAGGRPGRGGARRSGDVDRARAVVERLERGGPDRADAVGPRRRRPVVAALVDGGVAVTSTAAIAALDRALRRARRPADAVRAGRTLLAKGRLHRRRKEKRLADETLREALAIFESLGAPDWARRTGAELAGSGAGRTRRTR